MLSLPPTDAHNWCRYILIHTIDCPHGNRWFLPWHSEYIGWFKQSRSQRPRGSLIHRPDCGGGGILSNFRIVSRATNTLLRGPLNPLRRSGGGTRLRLERFDQPSDPSEKRVNIVRETRRIRAGGTGLGARDKRARRRELSRLRTRGRERGLISRYVVGFSSGQPASIQVAMDVI
jgi:hypothetical protein